MFRTATIFHTRNIVPKNKVNELILKLHETGISQVKKTEINDDGINEEYLTPKEVSETQLRLNTVSGQIDKYREIIAPENMLKQMFFPDAPEKHEIDLLSNEEILKEVNAQLSTIEPIVQEKLAKLEEAVSRIDSNEYIISNLESFPKELTNLFESTENISIIIGTTATDSIEKISEKLPHAVIGAKEKDEKYSFIFVATTTEKKNDADKVLHEIGFETTTIPFEKNNPQQIMTRMRNENNSLKKKISTIENELKTVAKEHSKKLDILEEELGVCLERIEAYNNMHRLDSIAVLEAWVPETNMEKFHETLKEECKEYYTEVQEKEEAPTILQNPGIVKPFEIITGLYAMPKYKGFDPTPFLAISFPFFFGFMLTDFAYGILLSLFAFLLYNGAGKYDEGIKQFSALLIISGIFTAVLGGALSSYFGDFFPRIGIPVPGLLDPMVQVLELIVIALIIAVIHMFIGLLIGYYDNVKHGRIKQALGEQGVWLFFLIGVIFMILGGTGIFATIGMGLLGLSVLTQLGYNMKDGPVISLLSIFNFSGFLGDVFSYARLTALAIGTAGIGLAVNFMALMVVDMVPVVGIIFGAIIFIGGHLFNMVMNGLGAFIHALRLHFLEFFSKFYEGGGKLYRPFIASRKKNKTEVM